MSSSDHLPNSGVDATEEAVIEVFKVFLTLPNSQQLLIEQQPLPVEFFIKNAVVAKELFSHEPGCAVNYQAIQEKIKILEPHFQVTSSGCRLMAYFADLSKLRSMWALAFAQYESHTIMSFMYEQTLYGRTLNAAERNALNPQGPQTLFCEGVKVLGKQLQDLKASREFAQYVHILEECVKKYKIHVQRKAQAEKARQTLMRKKKAEARKATKAASASASPPVTQQNVCVGSAFNPDLPDFAQFVHSYATQNPAAAAGFGSKDLGPAHHQPADTPLVGTNLTTQPSPAAEAGAEEDSHVISNAANATPTATTATTATTSTTAETTNLSVGNGTADSEFSLPPYNPVAFEEAGGDWQYRDGDSCVPSLFTDEDERFFRELFGADWN